MTPAPLPMQEIVYPASATITAAAALYMARSAKSIVDTVEENQERSQTNRKLLLGESYREGVFERLRRIEEELGITDRGDD